MHNCTVRYSDVSVSHELQCNRGNG